MIPEFIDLRLKYSDDLKKWKNLIFQTFKYDLINNWQYLSVCQSQGLAKVNADYKRDLGLLNGLLAPGYTYLSPKIFFSLKSFNYPAKLLTIKWINFANIVSLERLFKNGKNRLNWHKLAQDSKIGKKAGNRQKSHSTQCFF